jgi:phage minor structural protein
VGAKVTSAGQNYQLNSALTGNEIYTPPGSSGKWAKIANRTTGSPVLVMNKNGADLYYVSGPDDGWYKMSTPYGLEGYIKSSQVTYDRHLTPSETHDRLVTEQLFRIKKVTVDTKGMTVSVTAEHVSYDLSGVLMETVNIVRQPPAQSISWIENAFMIDYPGTIASNIVESEDRLYTAEMSGKNGMYALLDPDKGVVAQFEAAFRRDNWDLFVMEKTNTDQGFRIRYGNNLLGVNWKISSDQLITRIVPVAKDEDGGDLYLMDEEEEDPDYDYIWIDSQYINNYPVIRMERLKVDGQVGKDDGTETDTMWTKAALREEMAKQAEARFTVDKVDQLRHEITIDFVRLGDTDEYKQFKDLQRVRLYDTVIAVDPRIDLSVSVQVTEIEFDAINERVTALKLSNIEAYNLRNTAGFNVLNNSITGEKLTDEAGKAIVGTVKDDAVAEANAYTSSTAYTLRAWVTSNFQPIS